MMRKLVLLGILLVGQWVLAQKNFIDQPYLETSAKADSMVIPDRIYLNILLNEADSKNRISVEEQEQRLEKVLKSLGIEVKKDLSLQSLGSNYQSYFLRGQNVVKQKRYNLLVRDAVTAGKVLMGLEQQGISNVYISKVEYSKAEELLMTLKAMAVAKSHKIAENMVKPLGQKLGKAIHMVDESVYYTPVAANMMMRKEYTQASPAPPEPIDTEFKKIKFEASVRVVYQLD